MKKIFLSMTIALSFTSVVLQAQPHRKLSTNKQTALQQLKKQRIHDAILSQMLGSGQPSAAAKPTATVTDERLVASSNYNWFDATGSGTVVWTKTDSARHMYSGEHGSKFNYNNMTFDPFYSLYSTQFMGQGLTFGAYDKDYKPGILSDSSIYYFQFTADTVEPVERVTSVYDAANNITNYTDEYMPFAYAMRNLVTYNSSNRPTSIWYLNTSGAPTWDTSEYRTLGYNGDTLTFDSTAYHTTPTWDPEYKFVYTYDASGKATSISLFTYDASTSVWYESNRYNFEYYPSNKLQKFTYLYSDGTTPMEVQEVDSFGWGAGGILTSSQYLYYSSGVPDQKYVSMSHLNTAGLPDTTYTQEFYDVTVPAPDYESATVWTYDTYKNPVTGVSMVRTTPTSAFDSVAGTAYYYYQTYTREEVGVKDVDNSVSVKLYPNPVTNQLLVMQTAGATQVTNVVVYNIVGQQVSAAAGQGSIAVNMSGLATGTYMVMLQDAQGNTLRREKVVKL